MFVVPNIIIVFHKCLLVPNITIVLHKKKTLIIFSITTDYCVHHVIPN